MSADHRVTVVIPSYGRPDQLKRAINSVARDMRIQIEIVVVDDASPDGPPETTDFNDSRVRVVPRKENGGVAAAQNTGLQAAAGRYIAFLHSDDEWLPGRLERQIPILDAAGVAAVESPTLRASDGVEKLAPPRMAGHDWREMLRREVRDLHISGWLFRRSALTELGGFDEHLRCYEDLDLLIRLTQEFEVTTENGAPVTRIHTGGADRLGISPWMKQGRRHLVRKYAYQFDSAARLPDGWRDWCIQVAADLLEEPEGDRREVLELLHRARRGRFSRFLKTLDLTTAAHLPPAFGSLIAARRRKSWQRQAELQFPG